MEIKRITGDLRYLPMNFVVHQANCFTTMGAGIAASLAQKYPAVRHADNVFVAKHLSMGLDRHYLLGWYSSATVINKKYNREMTILNVYSQFHYQAGQNDTKPAAISSAFTHLKNQLAFRENGSEDVIRIGVPALYGAGLAAGNPEVNQKAMIDALKDCPNVILYFVDYVADKHTLD